MATIRQRGSRFQVQIRHCGLSIKTKSFSSHAEAEKWAAREESRFEGVVLGQPTSDSLKDLLIRYAAEITPTKKGAFQEGKRISHLLKDRFVEVPLRRLSGGILASFRDRRIKDGVRTCQYDLVLIRHVLEVARKEWGYYIPSNPVDAIKIPNGIRKRDRDRVP